MCVLGFSKHGHLLAGVQKLFWGRSPQSPGSGPKVHLKTDLRKTNYFWRGQEALGGIFLLVYRSNPSNSQKTKWHPLSVLKNLCITITGAVSQMRTCLAGKGELFLLLPPPFGRQRKDRESTNFSPRPRVDFKPALLELDLEIRAII